MYDVSVYDWILVCWWMFEFVRIRILLDVLSLWHTVKLWYRK